MQNGGFSTFGVLFIHNTTFESRKNHDHLFTHKEHRACYVKLSGATVKQQKKHVVDFFLTIGIIHRHAWTHGRTSDQITHSKTSGVWKVETGLLRDKIEIKSICFPNVGRFIGKCTKGRGFKA